MQAELSHPDLGALVIGTDPYVLAQLQIGSPAVRANTKNRPLVDGVDDDSRFVGARAITATIRMKSTSRCEGDSMQQLIDRITPYMHPRLRPTLTWQLPASSELRAATVRGVSWPYAIASPKHPAIILSWVAPSGEIVAGGPNARQCVTIRPASDGEAGREYDRDHDVVYPPSDPIGYRTIVNTGNGPTHWDLTIHGPVVDPEFVINGTVIAFNRDGGVTVPAGEYLTVDTRDRTAFANGDPLAPVYSNLNYDEWDWDEVRLRPGTNTVIFRGDDIDVSTAATLCWTPSFI